MLFSFRPPPTLPNLHVHLEVKMHHTSNIFFLADSLKNSSPAKRRKIDNPCLAKLDVTFNQITTNGFKCLVNTIIPILSLQELWIGVNKLFDDAIDSIKNHLSRNRSLISLDIGRNPVSDRGISTIAQVLEANITLKQMNLSNISISDVGMIRLCNALAINDNLEKLDLSCNKNITQTSCSYVVDMLKRNTSVKQLLLNRTGISEEEHFQLVKELSDKGIVLHRIGRYDA